MDLWCFNIDELPDVEINFQLRKLPSEEQDYILKFQWLKDRKHRLMARLMLQKYLFENGFDPGVNLLKKDEKGCPYIEKGPHISIAHSGKFVVLAIDVEHKIGIDIEEKKAIDFNLVTNNFHPDEISYLQQFKFEANRFYEIWTKKEALLKALGIGMMEGLDKISVLQNPGFFKRLWYYNEVNINNDYTCTICCSSNVLVELKMLSYGSF